MGPCAFGLLRPQNDEARLLLTQQVVFARQQVLGLGVVSTVIALLIGTTFTGMAPWPVTAGWGALALIGLVVTVSGWRLQRKKGREPSNAHRSAKKLFYQSLVVSALWGIAYWFTMPDSDADMQLLLIFFAAGSAAGLVAGFGAIPTLWVPMVVLSVLPPAVCQAIQAGRFDIVTSGGLVLFVGGLAYFGATAYQSFVRLVRLQHTAKNLADQKSRAETELEHFFERTNALTAVADAEGILVRLNPSWQKVFGYTLEEMLGRRSIDFIHPDDKAATMEVGRNTREGQPIVNHVNRFRAKDGSYRWLQWNTVRNPVNGTILASAADITDREDARIVKEKLVATVSHELRTPLTALRAALQILASGIGGSLPGSGERMLGIAERNADRLIALTDDILDLERIDAHTMDVGAISPNAMIAECVDELQPMLDSFAVRATVEDQSSDTQMLGDPARVRQVLHNLLSNAIKFSPLKGEVRIVVSTAERAVRISVADEGPGIPPGSEEKVFERFVQLPRPVGRQISGTGLGLAIARELVSAMNGRIEVEKVDRGARLFFELPQAGGSTDEEETDDSAPALATSIGAV